MIKYTLVSLTLFALVATSAVAGPWPNPPRNGHHSVQAIFGGRDAIPMCIVPPRTYEDGSPIPNGTTCTIVVYRSRQEGKPGTYTEEVGRGTGPVEREWIDVAAKVPPEGPNGGVIYLASSAIVNGEQSDLNNQYLTIVWAPGSFDIKEYPAAGSKPGAPPGRKPRPGPEVYPEWMKELSAIVQGGVGDTGGAAAYTVETPPLDDLNSDLDSTQRLKLTLKLGAGDALTGSMNVEPWLAEIRADNAVKKVETRRNEVKGTLTNGVLDAVADLQVVVQAAFQGQTATGTMSASTTLRGTKNAAGEIPGRASTTMTLKVAGDQPQVSRKEWDFTAVPGGARGKTVLLSPDNLQGALAAPGRGFETGGSKIAPGIIGGDFQKDIVGTMELDVGGSHFFSLVGRNPNLMLDKPSGHFVGIPGVPTRKAGDQALWYVGPGGVLESSAVGDGVRVTAVGEGMGEVWCRSLWDLRMPDGSTCTGAMTSIWVVPVGTQARNRVSQSRTGGGGVIPPYTGEVVGPVTIIGKAVVRSTMKGIGGAQVHLWRESGGTYTKPDWVTGEDGSFRIVADASLPGGGLIPGRYEIMVQWRPGGANAGNDVLGDNSKSFVDDDLWPFKRHMIDINKETAAQGPIVFREKIRLVPIKNMDWSQRE